MKRAVFLPHIYELSKQNNISIEEALLITRNEGYSGVDANWADISSKSPELKIQLKNANINIASIYRVCNMAECFSIDDMEDFFEGVVFYNASKAMLVPSFYSDNISKEDTDKMVTEALNLSCDLAKKYGITVTVENYGYFQSPCGSFNQVKKLLDNVPNLRYTLDTGNYTYYNEDVIQCLLQLKDRINHVHLKDWCLSPFDENEQPAIETLSKVILYPSPIGKGIVPIQECLNLLKDSGYQGYLTAEFFGAKNMLNYLKLSSPKSL